MKSLRSLSKKLRNNKKKENQNKKPQITGHFENNGNWQKM